MSQIEITANDAGRITGAVLFDTGLALTTTGVAMAGRLGRLNRILESIPGVSPEQAQRILNRVSSIFDGLVDSRFVDDVGDGLNATRPGFGLIDDSANFAQTTFRDTFTIGGRAELSAITGFPIRTIDDLVSRINSGAIDPGRIPVNFIVRDGNTLTLNTRTAQALQRAGTPRSQFNAIDRTGDAFFETLLDGQLSRNELDSSGFRNPVLE